jgi:hypothetical protein
LRPQEEQLCCIFLPPPRIFCASELTARLLVSLLCFALIFTTTPLAHQQSLSTAENKPVQSRQLPPYADLPDISALVDEGKNPKPAKPQPPLKPSTLCGYHDKVCQKIKEKKEKEKDKKIGQYSVPGSQSRDQMSASAEPKRGGWLRRLGRVVSGAFSGPAAFSPAGHSFLPATNAKSSLMAKAAVSALKSNAPPPPPTFSSLDQARLDPRNRLGGASEDLFSGNFHWSLPLVSLPGRNGLDLNLSLHYNSLVWLRYNNIIQFDPDFFYSQNYSSLTPGFRLGLPLIEGPFSHEGNNAYFVILPSGARVGMRYVAANEYEAMDSSYLYLKFNPAAQTATLYTTEGTQYFYSIPSGDWWYRCTQIKDSNGNFLTIGYTALGIWPDQVYAVSTIADTVGRVITFNYDSYLHLLSITQAWQGQTRYWAQFDYEPRTIQTNFAGLTVQGPTNNTQIPVITRVITGDGARHTFVYNSWGQVEQLWQYGEADNPRNAMIYVFPGTSSPQTDCPRFNQRNDGVYGWAGQTYDPGTGFGWVSTYFYFHPNETEGWVTPPDGVIHKEFFDNSMTSGQRGLTTKLVTVWNNQTQKFTEFTWASDSTSGVPLRPRVTETKVTDDIDHNEQYTSGTDKQSRTTISYTTIASSVKLPWIVKEYNADTTTVYRSTKTDYLTDANYIASTRRLIGLPSLSRLYQGDVESSGTLVAQTGFVYDSPNDATAYLQAHASKPSQHDSLADGTGPYGTGFLYRGNLTKVRRFSVTSGTAGSCPSGCTETKTGYFITGNVALTKVQRDASTTLQSSIIYDDSFLHISEPSPGTLSTTTVTPGSPTFAYPTRVIDPDGFSSTVAYNYDFGAVTRTVDPKEYALHGASPLTRAISTYDYLGRLEKSLIWKEKETAPGTAEKYSQTRYVYSTDHNWTQTFTTVNNLNEETFVLSLLDGASRERIMISEHPGSVGGLRSQYVVYDIMGRITERSNPTEINGSWAPSGDDAAGYIPSFQSYDWNHRPLVTTHQDGTTRSVSYTGCGCAGGLITETTNEVERKQKAYSDVFGRIYRTEILHTNQSIYSSALMEYNVHDQPLSITEYAGDPGSGGASQQTTMTYDGYGRLLTRKRPLDTAPTTFTYYNNDTLQSATDARGAVSTYTYNNRNLVTDVTYTVPSGVAATPNVHYSYDEAGSRTQMMDGLGSVTYAYDVLSSLSSETRSFTGLSGTYKLSYAYNLAGQVGTISYESSTFPADNNSIYYAYNKVGGITAITGTPVNGISQYASDLKYRAWGSLKSLTFGNGNNLTAGYYSTQQIKTFEISVPGSSSVMKAEYFYHNDGRIKYAKDLLTPIFNRAYGYGVDGSLHDAYSGSEADDYYNNTNSGTATGPFRQTVSSDVFGKMNFITGRHWSRSYESPATEVTRDAAGHILNDTENDYTYDAAGRNVTVWEHSPGQGYDTQGHDGDGQVGKRYTGYLNLTRYYLRSSVLNGKVITEIRNDGKRGVGKVYLGDRPIATQSFNTGSGSGQWLVFEYENPVTKSRSFYEPNGLGAHTGYEDPYQNQPPTPDPALPYFDLTPANPYGCGSFRTTATSFGFNGLG